MLDGPSALVEAVRHLDRARVKIDDLSVHRPSLDDVFFALTGRTAEQDGEVRDGQPRTEGAEV